ncbi:MAG: hypothetical protein IPJ15_05955 [Actinomycetales bacterium]|nr:hypothetical protein [Candidatus Phosphoribacter baldrii]
MTPRQLAAERAAMAAAVAGLDDSVRAILARHRAGALVNELDDLAKAVGDALPDDVYAAGRSLSGLLERVDRGPGDREWRARTWGVAQ